MAFVVLYDACVLYPAPLRDLLIRLANKSIVRARWSEAILDECFRNILANRTDLRPEALERTRELMRKAVPDCMVSGFEALIEGIELPDCDDRHVLAAAIRAGAQTIVTFNLADFPVTRLASYNVEAKHPDGKSEAWITDRTGHTTSAMIYRYKRAARSAAELQLGDFAPRHDAIPELRALGSTPKGVGSNA